MSRTLFRLAVLPLLTLALGAGDRPLFIRNARIHPVEGAPLARGSMLIEDGRIAAVGPDLTPPPGAEVVEAEGLDAYPGFMDAGGRLGLVEVPSVRATVDTSDPGDFLPQLQAATAVHLQSGLIPVVRVNGVTHALAIPGLDGGSLMPGQASAWRLEGRTIEEAGLKAGAALVLRWPTVQGGNRGFFEGGGPVRPFTELKQEQEKRVQAVKDFFERARRHHQNPAANPSPALAALGPALKGEVPVLLQTTRARDLKEALAFLRGLKVKIVVVALEEIDEAIPELKAAGASVLVDTGLAFPRSEDRPYDHFQTLPGRLRQAGIPIAFASLGEPAEVRSLPYDGAGNAVAHGLSHEAAIEALTLAPARMFGLDRELGSLVAGKEATFFLVKGDPLDFKGQVTQLYIQGRRVSLDNRHQQLYEAFKPKP
jgi:imidazolonepropionase-like amidohydrolase